MECKYCKNNFSSKSSLRYHQKTAKYCIKIQGKETNTFRCDFCKKTLSTKQNLMIHQSTCSHYNKYLNNQKWEEEKKMLMKEYELRLQTANSKIRDLQYQLNNKDETITELQDKLENIATASILNDKDKIMKLTKKYVRKRPRQQFDERNVVYIITTPSLKKERRYILGKATNLTNRLSTYNKTDEHEVVFYKSCNSKEMMSCIENMVFNKLSRYREQANRERFILPEDQEISFFSNKIEECINFLS